MAEWFAAQGFPTSSVEIIEDYATGRSRGFGFVEIETEMDADNVVRVLTGKIFAGRPLTIGRAAPFRRNEPDVQNRTRKTA